MYEDVNIHDMNLSIYIHIDVYLYIDIYIYINMLKRYIYIDLYIESLDICLSIYAYIDI